MPLPRFMRPPPEPTKHVTAVLSREEHEILRRYAFDRRLSLSGAIAALIREHAIKKEGEDNT
jgi:hypothetical protein